MSALQPAAARVADGELVLGYILGMPGADNVTVLRDVLTPEMLPLQEQANVLGAIYRLGAAAHPVNIYHDLIRLGLAYPPLDEMFDWVQRANFASEEAFVACYRRIKAEHAREVAAWNIRQAQEALDRGLDPCEVQRTLAQAAQAVPAAAPARRHLLHADELGRIPQTTWLIPGVLGLNKLSQLFGAPGSGKSLLALDQALCVAQVAPVVYVAAEAPEDYKERVAAWCAQHQRGRGDLYFWDAPIPLADERAVAAFIAEIAAVQPALIVIDPLAACLVGLEESSSGDMTIAVDALNRIRRETRAAVNVVHHTGWSTDHERGSSVLRAACRVVIKLTSDDGDLMTLSCEKANNGKPFDARYFRRVAAGPGVVPVPASRVLSTRQDALSLKQLAILDALDLRQHQDGASYSQILDVTEQNKSTLHRGLSRLLERGLIALDGRLYTLSEAGRHALSAAQDAEQLASSASSLAIADGELVGNWEVNRAALEAITSNEKACPDAEFQQFPADPAPVPHDSGQIVAMEFPADSAAASARSLQFPVSSLESSPSQFPSSPVAPPLWGAGGEPEQGTAALPAGVEIVGCDYKGYTPGPKFKARGPDGETEPVDYRDWAVRDAWQRWGQGPPTHQAAAD